MHSIQLKGRAPTLRDQQKAAMASLRVPSVVDFEKLRADLNAKVFVGPPKPDFLRVEFSHDAEFKRYWNLVDQFNRYGHCELECEGTLSMASWMGYTYESSRLSESEVLNLCTDSVSMDHVTHL